MKDLALQREQTRKRVKRYRDKGKGVDSVTISRTHPLMYALANPVERDKLRRICQELEQRRMLDKLYYGLKHPIRFDMVSEYLSALS